MAQSEGNATRHLIRSVAAPPPGDDPAKRIADQLLAAARSGRECRLGLVAPNVSTPENAVPSTLLRVLALGGDVATPVHDQGLRIRGAYISGALDLRGATLPFDISFRNCRFEAPVILQGARGRTIALDGCRLPRLMAESLRLDGALFMRDAHIWDKARLSHARIGGVLDCSRARISAESGCALTLHHAEVSGGVFFSHAEFAGGADLLGVRIDGDLVCHRAAFIYPDKAALRCQSVRVAGRLIVTRARIIGSALFAQAEAGVLMDAGNVWPDGETVLDDFRYHRIAATAPLDSGTRIAWLRKQPERFLAGDGFVQQPWTHLAHVLREQGHHADAARVDMARETLLRKAGLIAQPPSPLRLLRGWRKRESPAPGLTLTSQLRLVPNIAPWALHWFYGAFSGYGYRPGRIIYFALALWIGFGFLYSYVAEHGGFGPADPLIYQNPTYEHCRPDAPERPSNGKGKIGNWLKCAELPANYTSFSPFAYSADLILPVAKLGQNADWTPLTSGDDWNLGYVTRMAVWIEEILGWAAALTLAAIASGLVKRGDRE